MNLRRILLVIGGVMLGALLGLIALRLIGNLDRPRAALAVGQPAPAFQLEALDGGQVTLSQFQGKVVLLNFWATWCKPCENEMPLLEAAYRQYGDRLTVLAVNAGEGIEIIRPFAELHDLTFPILLADRGRTNANYNIGGYPSTFIIDAQGVLRRIFLGELKPEALESALQEMGIAP